MNRILLADVILTLTTEQALNLVRAANAQADAAELVGNELGGNVWLDLALTVREQCARQGVSL